jgi:hypothetical protein
LTLKSFYLAITNSAIDHSNFVAPTAASPYYPNSNGKHRAIFPYSLYQRRLEEQRKNQSKVKLTSTATNSQYNQPLENAGAPVYIYLPAFPNANQSQIAEEADAAQRFGFFYTRIRGMQKTFLYFPYKKT